MAFAFEKLIVYQKAVDFADQITCQTGQFPRGFYFLADQLNRASLSIAANIAEGKGEGRKSTGLAWTRCTESPSGEGCRRTLRGMRPFRRLCRDITNEERHAAD